MDSFDSEVKVKFKSSNFVPDNTGTVTIGEYAIEQVPSTDNSEAILTFKVTAEDPFLKNMLHIQSRLETEYFLSFLSLVSLSNCEFQAGLLGLKNVFSYGMKYTLARKPFNFDVASEFYQKLRTLPKEDKRRFVNACKRYRQAISIYDKEPVVSFFLLVVAIECLSNSLPIGEKDVDWGVYERFYGSRSRKYKIPNSVKFVEFISKYLPGSVLDEEGDIELFKKRLLSAYMIRNWFVHNGEDLPGPVTVADRLKKRSLVYKVVRNHKEYEIRAPALIYLERIVVNALMGFLNSESGKCTSAPVFSDQAKESGAYAVKLREGHPSIQKGQAIDDDFAKKYFVMDP
jgi:hypothetical protein